MNMKDEIRDETTLTLRVEELDVSYHKPVMSLTIEGRADKLSSMHDAFAEFLSTISEAALKLQAKR